MITPEKLEEILRKSIKESAEKEINSFWINRLVSVFIERVGESQGEKWQSIADKEHFLDGRGFEEEH